MLEKNSDSGFTLVELIVVILLIAILSVYAASKLFGRDTVSAFAVQEQVISVVRQVQLNRMQSNLLSGAANTAYVLAIHPNCVGSQQACSGTDSRSDKVQVDSVQFSSNPVLTQVTFDLLGNPESAASAGVQINIVSSGSSASACINSQGFVSKC